MSYMLATAHCFGCRMLFSFNPDLVPSITVNGSREPICKHCVERANPRRIERGLEPILVLPGAYEAQEVA